MEEVAKPVEESSERHVMLDGNPVTISQLEEARQNPNVRIIEVFNGVYKTLNRMQG